MVIGLIISVCVIFCYIYYKVQKCNIDRLNQRVTNNDFPRINTISVRIDDSDNI